MKTLSLQHVDAIILCGGLGTRLRPVVGDVPKALSPLGGTPFLSILLRYLKRQGIARVILGVGYGGEQIKSHYEAHPVMAATFSEETEQLGTGGALKQALAHATSDHVIAMNGDTFCPIDFADFLNAHRTSGAMLSMVVAPKEREDGGSVTLGDDGIITAYEERAPKSPHPLLSAGIYLMKKEIAALMPERKAFSLEEDFFPRIVGKARCVGFPVTAPIIDIGTPERYREAAHRLPKEFFEITQNTNLI